MENKIHLSDHFTFKKLFKFTISPMLMMLFTSIYWIVDGFFISNFAGSNEFAGVNLIFPIVMVVACIGFMFGSGGAALVSKRLGEGDVNKANRTFSLITIATIVIGIIFSVVFFFLVEPIARGFAAINSIKTTEKMIKSATLYGQIMIGGVSLYILQGYFHPFFSVNEKSHVGFYFTLVGGLTNMLLDYLLIGVANLSVIGAAVASLSGMFISGIGPIIYFRFGKNNLIKLVKPEWSFKDIIKAATNGSSEFVSNISGSVVSIVFNIQLLKYIGEDGVSAYGIIAYVCFIFFSLFIGYSAGVSPIISYNLGSGNKEELSNVYSKSLVIVISAGIIMSTLSIALAKPLTMIFASNYPSIFDLTVRAMRIYSICYLLNGVALFGSAFFTALNNGLVSAVISFLRTLVFQIIAVFTLPLIFGVDGIWSAFVVAEFLAMVMTFLCMYFMRKKYGYHLVNPFKRTE